MKNKQAPLAQLAEQLTLNQWVLGSSPRGRTSKKIPLILRNRRDFCVPLEMQFLGLRSLCSALFLMARAACFLCAYAGAPVTRTLRSSLLRYGERPCDTLRAHPENAARYRRAPRLLCASVVQGLLESRRFVGVRGGFVCAPCLANWGGGGLSPFSLLLGGWCFARGAGEGCRLSGFCEIATLVCAEGSVPSVATSGCPKRSEGGCPCRSEDVHRPLKRST